MIAMMATMKAYPVLVANLALFVAALGGPTVFAQSGAVAKPAPPVAVTVPFVGCASDGQAGPQAAPTGQSLAVQIPAALAHRLAYYKSEYGPGALAPRGWNCFSTYGSDGANLFVSPDPINTTGLSSMDWKGFTGLVIEVSEMDGGTSGRFQVAKVIARVFPAHKTFAQNVIAEGIEPASDFPFGPYPGDKLTYRGKNIVEFETPANAQGLGTNSRLQANASPIDGVAIIGGADTDLIQLSARVPASDSDLIPAMVGQAEKEALPIRHNKARRNRSRSLVVLCEMDARMTFHSSPGTAGSKRLKHEDRNSGRARLVQSRGGAEARARCGDSSLRAFG